MTYQKVFKKSARAYRHFHEGKTPLEIDFYKTYQKYPTEREVAQFLPWYNQKNKIEIYDTSLSN